MRYCQILWFVVTSVSKVQPRGWMFYNHSANTHPQSALLFLPWAGRALSHTQHTTQPSAHDWTQSWSYNNLHEEKQKSHVLPMIRQTNASSKDLKPGHLTSMKYELGLCTSLFFLCCLLSKSKDRFSISLASWQKYSSNIYYLKYMYIYKELHIQIFKTCVCTCVEKM